VVGRPERELQSSLDRVVAAGLLFQQGLPPHGTYLFKHALVQDAAYGTLLRQPRRALHARIAEALEDDVRFCERPASIFATADFRRVLVVEPDEQDPSATDSRSDSDRRSGARVGGTLKIWRETKVRCQQHCRELCNK
jgi:hypothetical protein